MPRPKTSTTFDITARLAGGCSLMRIMWTDAGRQARNPRSKSVRSTLWKVCVALCLACAGLVIPAQAQDLPTGNPKDFKVRTCLHSVSYSGAWRGQTALTLDQFLVKAHELGYEGVEIMAKRRHLSPLDYVHAARPN